MSAETVFMKKSIDDLDLSVRSYNCLKRAGISSVRGTGQDERRNDESAQFGA